MTADVRSEEGQIIMINLIIIISRPFMPLILMTKLLNSASTKSQEPFILNRHWKWHVIKEY